MQMSRSSNGHGNGNGGSSLMRPPQKKTSVKSESAIKESRVSFKTAEGVVLNGTLVRLLRNMVVFELYSPVATPRLSEALEEFKIILQAKEIYSGRAVVRNVVDA